MQVHTGGQLRTAAGPAPRGYRSLVVPVVASAASQRALEAAGRLAAARGAGATVVTVLEVPLDLPLDSRLEDEDDEARELLRRAQAVLEGFGVATATRVLRARNAGEAIADLAVRREADLIVVGTGRRARRGGSTLGRTVRSILEEAACRVLLVTVP